MKNSAQLVNKEVYMNQLPSVALNNADLKINDELTFVSQTTKEEEGRRPYTTLTYMRKADNKRIRLSLSVLDGMTNADEASETLPEETGHVRLPDSFTINKADDTDRYSIRDYVGFDAAFETAKKDWNQFSMDLRDEVLATATKATAKPIQQYTITVNHGA
tara:strand:- start:2076 stop:2558 length:483 start_codon:yes stop_codon:yes gene_type:complete